MNQPLDLAPIDRRARIASTIGELVTVTRQDVPALLAEVGRLRADLEPYESMSGQSCERGVHPDWLANVDEQLACPWCFIEQQRYVIASLRAAHNGPA